MYDHGFNKLSELRGLVVAYIDVFDDEILITTECGRKFKFYHDQDCCESVGIYDTKGDLKSLVGHRLIDVSYDILKDEDPDDVVIDPYRESFTWTMIKFQTTKNTVISRWLGESNGYYSERVDLSELTK